MLLKYRGQTRIWWLAMTQNLEYQEGIIKAIEIVDNCLEQDKLDMIPTSWMLKVIKHTLQEEVNV
jgi:hypothetical protein